MLEASEIFFPVTQSTIYRFIINPSVLFLLILSLNNIQLLKNSYLLIEQVFLSIRVHPSRIGANLLLFAGLIYRMVKPKVVLLIFVSGKIVLTGAKVRTDIYEAFENIYPVLTEFKKS